MISKVLVANRGEIARRVFRTCHQMGLATVAVHSDPDTSEPHVTEADEAIRLPGAAAADTYLNAELILAGAERVGADAIHPGYGFLSENAEFARAVEGAGLVWIGPPPEAIETMGSKIASKRLMDRVGVPTLPSVELSEETDLGSAAAELGFPVLVKASAGGGGKGMRVVDRPEDLSDAVEAAQREAAGAFGDGTIFLERYLSAPRHIEIQVFGDTHGRVVSLHERECSIQRRHQKIIEEAPSSALDEETRAAMGAAAVRAAEAVDYVGAGTVEFLYQDGAFFFLEMNTRLQVEHPVTEMITGLDLVRMQIEVATGGHLSSETPSMKGHSIEARLYAEDPTNDYLPVTGSFHRFEFPDLEGLRVDAGIASGSEVSVHYDPMIAKVIAHGSSREAAAEVLATALEQARIHGSTTNRALLARILRHPEFLSGEIDTHFLERHDPAELGRPLADATAERVAAAAAALADQARQRESSTTLTTIPSGWRNSPSQLQHRAYDGEHGRHDIFYSATHPFEVEGVGRVTAIASDPTRVTLALADREETFQVGRYGDTRFVDSAIAPVQLIALPRFPDTSLDDEPGSMHAPMPGKVIRVDVSEGDHVNEGTVLVVMEAMKMEHTLRSPHDGKIDQVLCSPGDQVDAGATLVVVSD